LTAPTQHGNRIATFAKWSYSKIRALYPYQKFLIGLNSEYASAIFYSRQRSPPPDSPPGRTGLQHVVDLEPGRPAPVFYTRARVVDHRQPQRGEVPAPGRAQRAQRRAGRHPVS